MKHFWFSLIISILFICSCEKESVTYTHWLVASGRYSFDAECENPDGSVVIIPVKDVLLVKDIGEGKDRNPQWVTRSSLDDIGFVFEPGYECVLRIRDALGKEDPEATDARVPSRSITLVKVVSKERKETVVDRDDVNFWGFL